MFRKHKVVWVSVIIVTVMLGSMGGGYAMAKASLNPINGNGVISAAYQKVNGMLRLVNGEEDVKPSEVFIQWNQVGLQGPQGEPGLDGENGDPGEMGPQGLSAFEFAVANGYEGTETEWLASLVGPKGEPGSAGEIPEDLLSRIEALENKISVILSTTSISGNVNIINDYMKYIICAVPVAGGDTSSVQVGPGADASWQITGLLPGQYDVIFNAWLDAMHDVSNPYWLDVATYQYTNNPVTVVLGQDTSGINDYE